MDNRKNFYPRKFLDLRYIGSGSGSGSGLETDDAVL